MADHGEVGEVPLDGGVQQGLGPRVAQRAAVLVQEVHQLLANKPAAKLQSAQLQRYSFQGEVNSLGGGHEVPPPVHVLVLPGEVLRHGPRGELRLADVAEVSREVDSLALHQRGQQRHVTSLPPPRRQRQAQPVQLVPQLLPAVLGLGSM